MKKTTEFIYPGYCLSHETKEIFVNERANPLLRHASIMSKLREEYPNYIVVYNSK